jgi:hypothetical protein
MYIFKQVFRIRMIFFLSSELYIKDKHSNGVKFSFQDFKIYYITQAHMCNISKHNNIIQYVNIENMGDREGIYFRLIHYIQHLRFIGINH